MYNETVITFSFCGIQITRTSTLIILDIQSYIFQSRQTFRVIRKDALTGNAIRRSRVQIFLPATKMNLRLVVPNSARPCFVNIQLVSLLPTGIFNKCRLIYDICFYFNAHNYYSSTRTLRYLNKVSYLLFICLHHVSRIN